MSKKKAKKITNQSISEIKKYKKIHLHEFTIMATMSSGKSTLINALLGEDLLPNENQACTSKIFKVIDTDDIREKKIRVTIKGNSSEEVNIKSLEELNNDKTVEEIIIEADFKGVKNKIICDELYQVCLVDTPGPNNSLESSHAEIAYKLIENKSSTHMIYVLNGTQIGINDDQKLLIDILDKQKKINNENEIIFVLNKMDEIDQEKECILTMIQNVRRYLSNFGIKEPKVIPLSAYAGKLFKLALDNKLVTRKEKNDFKKYYSYFEEFKISESKPLIEKKTVEQKILIGMDKFDYSEIMERLYATGIMDLEKELMDSLEKSIKNITGGNNGNQEK